MDRTMCYSNAAVGRASVISESRHTSGYLALFRGISATILSFSWSQHMTDSEALRLVFDRANALQTYWTFYATAVGALLAFFGTKKRGCVVAAVLTIAFLALSGANVLALRDVTRQRLALQQFFIGTPEAPRRCETIECKAAIAVAPATLRGVTGLHVLADGLVVVAIWLLVILGPEVIAGTSKAIESEITTINNTVSRSSDTEVAPRK